MGSYIVYLVVFLLAGLAIGVIIGYLRVVCRRLDEIEAKLDQTLAARQEDRAPLSGS